jgi:hypothetical protein
MSSNDQDPPDDQGDWTTNVHVLAELVQAAMDRAVREAIAEHHRAGHPVSIWRDGRMCASTRTGRCGRSRTVSQRTERDSVRSMASGSGLSPQQFMPGELSQFALGVVALTKRFAGRPGDFARGIADDYLPVR